MKSFRILPTLAVSATLVLLVWSCDKEDEAIKKSMKDVSSRITGFSSEQTGKGADLTINGKSLDQVERVAIGDFVVPKKSFVAATETSLSIKVPSQVPYGDNQVLLVFPGNARALSSIEVIPFPAITSVYPAYGSTGETITVIGTDLDFVTGVNVGAAATIASQTKTQIKFTMPAGATSGAVTLMSGIGNVVSTQQVVACAADASNALCKPGLNLNGGFELGDGDNFTNWGKYNGGTLMVSTTAPGEFFGGARALKVNVNGTQGGSDAWRIQMASDLVATEIGATYTASAWVKSTTASTIRFSTQPSAMYGPNAALTSTWTMISWSFTANVAETRVILDMGGGVNTTHYIDDVKLIKN